MAGRFKKVAESEQVPDYIERRFIPQQQEVVDDKYAHLYADATERQTRLAREHAGYDREVRAAAEQPWLKTANDPRLYDRPEMPFNPEDMNAVVARDLTTNRIRRAEYEVDNDRDSSPRDMAFVTELDATAIMMRGASIWDPQMDDMQEYCRGVMADDLRIKEREVRANKRQAQHEAWEGAHMDRLRPYTTSMRSDRVKNMRIMGFETSVAGRNNMVDYDEVNRSDAQRVAMNENRLQQRNAITRMGQPTREERHAAWETEAMNGMRATTMRDEVGDWINDMLGQLDNE